MPPKFNLALNVGSSQQGIGGYGLGDEEEVYDLNDMNESIRITNQGSLQVSVCLGHLHVKINGLNDER